MENHDKIYKQFEAAARKSEEKKGFDRMDAVWNRVEEKLDRKKERRNARLWKYTGIAALLLLFITIGFELTRQENVVMPETQQTVTVIDTVKVKEAVTPKTELQNAEEQVVVNEAERVKTTEIQSPKTTNFSTTTSGNIVEADSIQFIAKRKISRVWNSKINDTTKAASPIASLEREKDAEFKTAGRADIPGIYTGTIASASDGYPMPGVTVQVKGTANTTSTDFDGNYSIQAKEGDVLVINYIGFNTQEIKLDDKPEMAIALKESTQSLDEVVVVGYGATKKEAITGAVTKVDTEDLEGKTDDNLAKALKGRVAGVNVITSNTTPLKKGVIIRPKVTQGNAQGMALQMLSRKAKDEKVNSNAVYDLNVKEKDGVSDELKKAPVASTGGAGVVRANTNPLYIINGTEVKPDIIEKIDPTYIKSFKVIKETEAVKLYGGKAANGAVIVKTVKLSGTKKKKFEELVQQYKLSDKNLNTYEGTSKIPVDTEEYGAFDENRFESPVTTPLSTFSIDVDNASYTNVRRFINMGQMVPKDAVRVEEMINFFKYDYPQPKGDDPFSINTEYSACPWNPQHKLLKIGLKGREVKPYNLPASNFVFLIDISGSMADANKLPMLKKNMRVLVNKMRSEDQIAIVVYSGAAKVLLESTGGDDKHAILDALDRLQADGTTAGEDGLKLAYNTAEENFIEEGNNRVIMASDGDFNVGATSDEDMEKLIEEKRKTGVFLTCLGYGMGNYKDSKLETLADKGNGNYAYIDTDDEADRFLGKEFMGSMYTIAKDVKIQIEFNPLHVQSYRLIGYENRTLQDEDFSNDNVDAGELGVGHTVTALYEIIPIGIKSKFAVGGSLKYNNVQPQSNTNYQSELATIKFRYKQPDGDVSKEIVTVIPDTFKTLNKASGDFKFAAAVAWFGLKLRNSKLVPDKKSADIIKLAKEASLKDKEGYREEFINLVNRVE